MRIALLCLLTLTLAPPVFAEDDAAPPPPAEMETVTVTGAAEDRLTGSNTLNRATLEHLPARNGSINEAIGILPGVQLGEYSRTSDNAGEILPPNLSISGGRFYDNNFLIDGIGNNSLLDPAYQITNDISRVSGHPQEAFLHPSLIEQLTVLRSNVSARYGSFTGGVVEAETRNPADAFGGEINLRHTRNEWTELHYGPERQAEFDNPTTTNVQPKFRKYDASFSLDIPLADNSGVILAASRIYSKIPLVLVDETKEQYRTIDNYFVKYVAQFTPENRLTVSGSYTPYDADLFLSKVVNSDYTVSNRAYGLSAKLESRLEPFSTELNVNYRRSSNNREAPSNYFPWQVTTDKPWGAITDAGPTNFVSREGGYGDLKQEQSTWTATVHVVADPIRTSDVSHEIGFGLSYEEVDGRYERGEEFTNFSGVCGPASSSKLNCFIVCKPNDKKCIDRQKSLYQNIKCDPNDIDCIAGQQFFYQKEVYPANSTDATISFYDAYIENRITFGRLSLRPGVRFSSDDLQHNDNWAPRLAASLDVFGDGGTVLVAGKNRYYGKTLLTHALAEKRLPKETYKRDTKLDANNFPVSWPNAPSSISKIATRLADLKTPYTDEWTVGIAQKVLEGTLSLDYVRRHGKDELYSKVLPTDSSGYVYTEWTNDGRSDHKEATLSWEKAWSDQYLLLSATWQETETSNGSYEDKMSVALDYNKDGLIDPVWYRGQFVDREDLPRLDFNREWTVALTYIGRLPHGFTFTNVTRYRSGYTILADTKQDYKVLADDGKTVLEKYDIYDEIKQPESWVFDWLIEWEKRLWQDQILIVSLEINNVFDEKVEAGESIDVYDLGRQFWLGLTYKF